MDSTNSLVPSGYNLKSFWSRPEGKAGMLVLAGLGGLAIYSWGVIVPFLLAMMVDTVHLGLLVGGMVGALWVLFSPRTHLIFRLIMRYLTGLIITIDPIGILKDHLLQMRKRRARMEDQISTVHGQIGVLQQTIQKNHDVALTQLKQAEYAKKQSTIVQDKNAQLQMALQVKVKANKAGRLENANISYQQLLTKLQSIYDLLVKWAAHIDAYIEDTDDQVKQEEIRYKTINAAYSAYKTALAVVKGNTTEEDIYNTTMEYLAEEAGRKLGEIDDFQRVADGFMTALDVQNGAVSEDALKALDVYEAKLLQPDNTDTQFLLPGATSATAVPALPTGKAASNVKSASNDYGDIFK